MTTIERDIIYWGRCLYERKLITGWGGNISRRIGKNRFLITGRNSPLGFLTPKDLVEINSEGVPTKKTQTPSSESPLHLAVYKETEAMAVIHVHPPTIVVFSLANESFVPLSWEEKYLLKEIPVVPQLTPTVRDPAKVVEAIRNRPIVILKGHGTVAMGKDLRDAFLLTDLLEGAVHCQFLKDGMPSAEQDTAPQTGAVGGVLPSTGKQE